MPGIDYDGAFAHERIESFKGINTLSTIGNDGYAYCMKNFRVLSDGSIEKRAGVRRVAELTDNLRAITVARDGNDDVILAIDGHKLLRVDPQKNEVESASVFSASEGKATFISLDDRIFIVDNGYSVYSYDGGVSVTPVVPYIPLYGKGWETTSSVPGVINEPINLLTNRVRVSYKDAVYVAGVKFGMKVASLDAVYVGGELLPETEYTVNESKTGFSLTNGRDSLLSLVLYFTLDDSYMNEYLKEGSFLTSTFNAFGESRTIAYGGADKGKLYFSKKVTDSMLSDCLVGSGEKFRCYIPDNNVFELNNGDDITSVSMLYDRLLLMSESGAWVTDSLSVDFDELVFKNVLRGTGCSSLGGLVTTDDNLPVTVSQNGIYSWKTDSKLEYECVVKKLSDGIASLLSQEFFTRAIIERARYNDEIWLRDTAESEEGVVFIYNCQHKCWYMYCGVYADRLIEFRGKMAFVDRNGIFLFDESLSCDTLGEVEAPIEAVFESKSMEFSSPEVTKRLLGISAEADLFGTELKVALSDSDVIAQFDICDEKSDLPGFFEYRARSGRFRYAKLKIVAGGNARQRIYSVSVYATR